MNDHLILTLLSPKGMHLASILLTQTELDDAVENGVLAKIHLNALRTMAQPPDSLKR